VLTFLLVPIYAQDGAEKSAPMPFYIGIKPTYENADPRVGVEDKPEFLGFHMDGTRSSIVESRIPGLKRTVEMDSTGQNINFTETIGEVHYRVPRYVTLYDYVESRRRNYMREKFVQTTVARLGDSYSQNGGGGAIRIDIPVEIKSKAFQKIFGGGTVGLDVSGDISIKGGFRNEKRSQVKTALNRGSDNSFKMEQTQRFKVSGHVGEKVTIGVDQDSERTFDFENNINLEYQGYEDEIVQTIQAGNISLSLPGTRFVTSGSGSAGLFGIKTSAQIGNLKLVAVASQEKGEKKKLSLKGGASDETKEIDITRPKRGVYFFLDEYYRQQYIDRDEATGNPRVSYDRWLDKIEVYRAAPNYQQEAESIRGYAFVPTEEQNNEQILIEPDTSDIDNVNLYRGYFIRLEKDEYFVHDQMGYLQLNNALQEGEVLAVAYSDSGGRVRGMVDYNNTEDDIIYLRMLRTKDPRPSNPTWPLEWQNVYALGGRNISQDGFEFRIYYKPPSGDPQETVTDAAGEKLSWLQAFGFDKSDESGADTPDNVIDNNPWVINYARGEIYFPHLRPFDPADEKLRELLYSDDPNQNKLAPAIYDTTVQQVKDKQAKFIMEVKSQNKSAEYSLGMNVIEGSEEVTLNGRTLTSGIDYTIDYMFGRLVILNEQALAANANLDISYESNQLFQIDKKTVMGIRGEYGLWDDSFIGVTFMYLNESTLDQKIRVGKGPMRNMIWDVNTSLSAKPFFLTKAANFLPFVDTRQPSTIKFEGEIAQILPNPNTRNNPKTGDKNGVAYIDDFEASKRITPLPIIRKGWHYSSPPLAKYPTKNYDDLSERGWMSYHNPYTQYPISAIKPNQDLNSNVAQTTNILKMRFIPPDTLARPQDAWFGIQKALSSGYSNQTEAKYIEIWINSSSGMTANMHIDLGQVSEDIIPNKKLDTEDQMRNSIRNTLLDEGEDIGLDGMANDDPRAIAAGGDFWDINGNGQKDWGEPYSQDDWKYNPQKASETYEQVNGTEGNENDSGGRIPDTEDMNGNGDVDLANDYFHFQVSLDRNHPDYDKYVIGESIDIETGKDFGWRLYQIPLNEFKEVVGSPSLDLVEYVRIWFDNMGPAPVDSSGVRGHQIWIAEINLVGSDWKEQGVALEETPDDYVKQDSTFVLSVVNTHDNPSYRPPPGVEGEVDRITRVVAKEQALVMRVNQLMPGNNTKAQKAFYDPQDYINYKTLKMFVYGEDPSSMHIREDGSDIEFFFRFGADENNYYEVRQPVRPGWRGNNVEIDLIAMTQVKETTQAIIDSVNNVEWHILENPEGTPVGTVWKVRGKPALRNIKMLEAGVLNKHETIPFTGEVWMNELRLSNVKKDKGIAMRARLDFAWADLIRVNGEINRKDADFHNVAERFGTGDNQFSGNFGGSISVDKFLPAKLGLSIPVSMNYSTSESMPKYLPGSDIEVTDDFLKAEKAKGNDIEEEIKNFSEKKGYSVSFGFRTKSQNFIVKHILSPFKASYSENKTRASNSRQSKNNSLSQSGNMSWNLVFGRDNYIRPFSWLEQSRMLAKVSDMKFYYTPQNFTTTIAGTRSESISVTRQSELETPNKAFKITRGLSSNMKFLESLSLDMSRNYTNDMRDVPDSMVLDYLKNLQFGELTNIDQNTGLKFNPKLFSFLTTNFNYSVNFRYAFNRTQKVAAKSGTQGRTLTANGNFNASTLMKTIYKPKRGGRTAGGRRTTPGRTRPNQNETEKKDDEKTGFSIPIMGIVSGFVEVFDPFSVKYTQRTNVTTYGLTDLPGFAYQIGLTDSIDVPLEMQEEGGTSTMRNSQSENETFGLSSGIKIGRAVSLGFQYDESYQLNQSTTSTGQRSKSWMIADGDSLGGMPFPTWNLRVSGIEKLPFLKDWFTTISLDHGRAGNSVQTFTLEGGEEVPTKDDKTTQFRPLIGISFKMKNGMNFKVSYNTSNKETITLTSGQAGTRTSSRDLSLDASYTKKGDFRIPLPFLGRKRLQNEISFKLTFTLGDNITEKSKGQGYEISAETSKWILKPTVDYSFSNRVRGGTYFEIGTTHNKLIGDTSFKEFGINVNISIRGN
jgi:cell surface protein SprA